MTRNVKLFTLGCKTNQYESQAIRERLEAEGFKMVLPDERSDYFIINTCTVTAKADKEARWIARRCFRENPDAVIVITGCLAERDEEMIKELPGRHLIVKNSEKARIAEILKGDDGANDKCSALEYTSLKISKFNDKDRVFVKIQDGCDNFCSYCKVPYVRGRSRSRELQDIKEEIMRLLDQGYKELVLTGICLGDWGKGLTGAPELADLIEEMDKIDRDFRIRLSSIEPHMISDRLIGTIGTSPKICPHLHLPLQSGSDEILKSMNRKYKAREFISLIKRARRAVKNLSVTTDVLIGYPGESERDFRKTVDVVKKIEPLRLHIFTYSERNGTKASGLCNSATHAELKKRRECLEKVEKEISYKYRRRFIKKKVEGLIESKRDPETGLLTGYTERYIKVLLDGPDSLMGEIVPLVVTKVDLNTTYCNG